jgi:hypothetical protein
MGISILFPVIGQMILTFALLLWMGYLRNGAIKNREVAFSDIAIDTSRWPDNVRKVANCYSNQFELPVIFYVLCVVAFEVGATGTSMLLLAWAFVASRVVHAYIHTTSNDVKQRGAAFAAGLLIVLVMTVLLTGHLLFPAV